MVTQVAAGAQEPGTVQQRPGDGAPASPTALAAALVAALEQVLQSARRLLNALEPSAGQHVQMAPRTRCIPGGLSHRETEVLRLLAAGLSNRQIAATLFLSPRTVQRHIANLYQKIGIHCRAEAVAYALRHDLA